MLRSTYVIAVPVKRCGQGPSSLLARGKYIWAGASLLARASPEAAAFDSNSNRWLAVPDAPLSGSAATVWTGSSLLEWGALSPVSGGVGYGDGQQLVPAA